MTRKPVRTLAQTYLDEHMDSLLASEPDPSIFDIDPVDPEIERRKKFTLSDTEISTGLSKLAELRAEWERVRATGTTSRRHKDES